MKRIYSLAIALILSNYCYSQALQSESEKIATFCKIWGFLKYYHPEVAKGKLDWDNEFMTRVKKLSSYTTKQEISDYYLGWINSLGKVKVCKKCINDIPDSLKVNLDLNWLNDTSIFNEDLITRLNYIRQNRNQGKNYYVRPAKFIGNAVFDNEKPYFDSVFPSPEMRLLSLSRYWNMINYFFPYKYLIGEDWNRVLIEMVPKFKDAKDTTAYHLAMLELTVSVNDSHAKFSTKYTSKYFGWYWVPFQFLIIDNKALVTGFYNDSLCQKDDIAIGDVILKVENNTIEDILSNRYKFIGASNDAVKLRKSGDVVFNGQTDSVKITFERNGMITDKTIHRYRFYKFDYKRLNGVNHISWEIKEGNIGYLNLGLLKSAEIDGILKKLKNTKALIIDVRNYPDPILYKLALFLNKDKRFFASINIPDLSYPGVFRYIEPYYCGKKNIDYYKGKVVLLINEKTQSQAEFICMGLQTAPNVITIGSQTAGADGNASTVTFPGGYKVLMTGTGIYYPDGRKTQRVGLAIDIEVKPTIEGIKLGKDEVLDKALEIINR